MMNSLGLGWMFFPFFFAMGIFGFLIGILGFIFWIWMLIDCIKREFKSDIEKIIWVLVLIFLGILGAILYYLIVNVVSKKKSAHHKKRRK